MARGRQGKRNTDTAARSPHGVLLIRVIIQGHRDGNSILPPYEETEKKGLFEQCDQKGSVF